MFLSFIELHSIDASRLEKVILERLESDGIPLGDCRSQCYDKTPAGIICFVRCLVPTVSVPLFLINSF